MGEIAEDILNGECCALCGQYFVKSKPIDDQVWEEQSDEIFAHGYPVACKECWEKGCGYEKAEADTM